MEYTRFPQAAARPPRAYSSLGVSPRSFHLRESRIFHSLYLKSVHFPHENPNTQFYKMTLILRKGVNHVSINEEEIIISEEDWSLHRRGEQEQLRHIDKNKEDIKQSHADKSSEEEIITSHRNKKINIPNKSLDEYKIRHNKEQKQHIGQADGDSDVGDVLAQDGSATDAAAAGE